MSTTTTASADQTASTTEPNRTEFRLNAFDRCDACGAQAYVAVKVNGTELLYCGHHGTKYEAKLKMSAYEFHDERARILA